MKATKTRITLSRETIRELTSIEMARVEGGVGPTQAVSCQSCPHSLNVTGCLSTTGTTPVG